MNIHITTLISLALVSAKKSPSYRYGELAAFEEGQLAARTAKMNNGVWIIMPLKMANEKKMNFDIYEMKTDEMHMNKTKKNNKGKFKNPPSYNYGKKYTKKTSDMYETEMNFKPMSEMARDNMIKKNRRMNKEMNFKPMSEMARDNMIKKNKRMNKEMKEKRMNMNMKKSMPASYRYGNKYEKKDNEPYIVPMLKNNGPHPPFYGKKHVPSYNYGKKYMKKEKMIQMEGRKKGSDMRNIKNPMLISDVMALRDMKTAREESMIIKPLYKKPKIPNRSTERFFDTFETETGEFGQAVEIFKVNLGENMKQMIINIEAFDGMSGFMESEIMVLSAEQEVNKRRPIGRFNVQSMEKMKNPLDDLKDKIDFGEDPTRIFAMFFLILLGCTVIIVFFMVVFRAWVRLDERRQKEENRVLLKGELDSIHPISIVYKN